jgi:hypothetical protein
MRDAQETEMSLQASEWDEESLNYLINLSQNIGQGSFGEAVHTSADPVLGEYVKVSLIPKFRALSLFLLAAVLAHLVNITSTSSRCPNVGMLPQTLKFSVQAIGTSGY